MKQQASKSYRDLIISLDDLRKIESLVEKTFQSDFDIAHSVDANGFVRLEILKTASFVDDYKLSFEYNFKSDDFVLLADVPDMSIRKCRAISIYLRSTEGDKTVEISLASGGGRSDALAVRVGGQTPFFVDGFLAAFSTVVSSISPQVTIVKNLMRSLSVPIILLLACIIDYTWFHAVAHLIGTFVAENFKLPISADKELRSSLFASFLVEHPDEFWGTTEVFDFGASLFWATDLYFVINDYVMKIFPRIEFNFGPAHFNDAAVARRTLYVILSLIVIPFAVAIIANAV